MSPCDAGRTPRSARNDSAPATSSSLIVSISSAQLLTMASLTSYTGTLTLLVSPA